MQCGILRIKPVNKSGVSGIGKEEDRINKNSRNPDIDPERTGLNMTAAYRDHGSKSLYRAMQDKYEELGVDYPRGKDAKAMEQAVITASPEFFKDLGWDKDAARTWGQEDIPIEIIGYFNTALNWAEGYFGENNIISATIHFDETTPHLHIDYVPCVEKSLKRFDVYAVDDEGKLLRDERGHAVRARDEKGKVIYRYEEAPRRVSHTDFWEQRGGRQSYRKMQDDFYKNVSSLYGLERGEIDSGREHIEQEKYKAEKAMQEAREAISERDSALAKAADALSKVAEAGIKAEKAREEANTAKARQEEAEQAALTAMDRKSEAEKAASTANGLREKAEEAAAKAKEAAEREKALLMPLRGEIHDRVDEILSKEPKKGLTGKETWQLTREDMDTVVSLRFLLRNSERRLEQSRTDYDDLKKRYSALNEAYGRIYKEASQLKERAVKLEKELSVLKAAVSRMPGEIQGRIKSIAEGLMQTEVIQEAREAARDIGQHMHTR